MTQLTIQQAFDLAMQHHQAGRLQQAEQIYRQILAQQPDHAGVLHGLGVIAHQVGQQDIAVNLFRQAINLMPGWPEAHYHLGKAMKAKGCLDEAIAAYRQAVMLKPNFAEAHNNLGNALTDKGELDQAIAACRQAIALKPNFPEACNNLGNALKEKGEIDQAIAACRQAIALKPNFPEAHNNLGNALHAKGELDQAIAACRQAIALKPNFPEAHNNLGNALKEKGELGQAIAVFRQAIILKPNYAEAYSNLGVILRDTGRLDEAIAAFRQAITLKSDFSEAHNNLGVALNNKGQLDPAIAEYRQALALKPNYAGAYNNLGNALKDKGQLDEAIAAYRQAIAIQANYADAHSNLVLCLHYHPGFDAPAIAQELHRWNQEHAAPLKRHIQPHTHDHNPDRRLRIGYISPDFLGHPVGRFLLPLLANHDRQRHELFAYAQVPVPDAMTQRLRACTHSWCNVVGLSDAQVSDIIRRDQIDILVDLTLHAAHNRLGVFARKPAPVQITYLAYAGSSGLQAMDYRLSDPYLDPPHMDESVYSEQTLHLPESYWCYQSIIDLPPQPAPVLEQGFITFGCLNDFCKVNQPLLNLWAKLLLAVPRSRLLLHTHEGSHRQHVLEYLQQVGIDPRRVSFAGKVPLTAYFELYQSIDIALDTQPFGGGTTTCDALWMGVPVVSLLGKTAVGRAGLSILSNVALPELVAKTPEEYVQIAVNLANDLPRLQQLRSTLRQRMKQSPLMDAPRFARNIEAAYRQMWRKWCATPPVVSG